MRYKERLLEEILLAQVFRDTITNIDWVKNKGGSPHSGAANYSFLYILLRILDMVQPNSICEFGIGQTTKLTSQYVCYKNTRAQLFVIEDSDQWIKLFTPEITLSSQLTIVTTTLTPIIVQNHQTLWYKNIEEKLRGKTFDLILLDGPTGTNSYSRSGILQLLPTSLQEPFIIIIDDYDRKGEKQTANAVLHKLKLHKMSIDCSIYHGIKKQLLIFSPKFRFLKTL